jgi:hypothetical protein
MSRGIVSSVGILILGLIVALVPAVDSQVSKQEKIVELLRVTKTDSFLAEFVPWVVDQTTAQIKKREPDLPQDALDIIIDETKIVFGESRGQFLDSMVPLYAKYFSEAEIDAMIAFYETPLGQKLVEVTPGIMREAYTLGQQWGQVFAEEALARATDRLKREGYEL